MNNSSKNVDTDKESFNNRYSIRASVSSFDSNNISIDIYFSDDHKFSFYGEQKMKSFGKEKYSKLFETNGITTFNFNPQDIQDVFPYIQNIAVVGFSVEAGVVLQIVSSLNENDEVSNYHMTMITLTFTEEEKEKIQSNIAKALLANKS